MFRIARIRIRWISTNQHDSNVVLATQSARATGSTSLRNRRVFHPRNLQVRVQSVGFGSIKRALTIVPTSGQMVEKKPILSLVQALGTFDLPKVQLRVSWMGLGSMNRRSAWALGLFAVLLGIFAFTRLADKNGTNRTLDAEKVVSAGLIADDISLGNETIRMTHSPLDIGQSKDVFDNNIDTLMRGLEANPLVLDFEFPTPRPITGLVIDFGRMDFVIRVQVYGTESTSPVFYNGEYRQQPPIPHVEMNFVDGPKEVRRIYIEIEQLNPPEEIHIHVREVLFKE
jgi:hypothetical protein